MDAAERSPLRQALLPLVLALSTVAATAYYAIATSGIGRLAGDGNRNLLGTVQGIDRTAAAGLPDARFVAANPFDQRLVNSVIAMRAHATGDVARGVRETRLLQRLGWRSTVALQNLLWRAGNAGDQTLLMDTVDALLRREKLVAQVYTVLNLVTVDPNLNGALIDRLAARPSWRRYYLMSASDLTRPEEIQGRYVVMRAVQRRGDRLTRNEVAPILPKLVAIGRADEAFALWRAHVGGVDSPLADTDFARAAQPMPSDALPVPFEWQWNAGDGFYADSSRDGGGSFASIDWSGRGTPVFASQLTSAPAGRYRLEVTGEAPMSSLAKRLGFRLVCRNGAIVNFTPLSPGAGRTMRLQADEALTCSYPTLQLFGLVQPATSADAIVLRRVRLVRTGR